jgi:apolipoprotein N-acyltransferase
MELRIRVPRVPAGLFGNLLGVAGLIAFAVAVGGLLASLNVPGAWWVSLIVGALEAVVLSWIASTHAEAESEWAKQPTAQLAVVKPKAAKSA